MRTRDIDLHSISVHKRQLAELAARFKDLAVDWKDEPDKRIVLLETADGLRGLAAQLEERFLTNQPLR